MSGLRPRVFRFQVVMLGVIVLSIVAVGVSALGATDSAWVVVNADKKIDDRVSIDEELGIYLVKKGSRTIAFSDESPFLGFEERVVYCPTSQLFEAPGSGSKFDISGLFFAGPAPRGMTRYPVRTRGDEIQINIDEPVPGPSRARSKGRVRQPVGPYCIPY
jgi:nitrite reductase/ring-hydroxylating ferredoxin subunit